MAAKWFKPIGPCAACGGKASGFLMSERNEAYGSFCKNCAEARIAAAERLKKSKEPTK